MVSFEYGSVLEQKRTLFERLIAYCFNQFKNLLKPNFNIYFKIQTKPKKK